MAARRKPKLAVWKFASCDGCQLSLLDCEDELLAVAGAVEIAYFLEATRADRQGPLRSLAGRGLDHHRARRRAHPARSAASRARWSRSAPAPRPAASRRCATSPMSRNSPRSSTRGPTTSRRSPPRRRSRSMSRSISSCAAARSTSTSCVEVIGAFLAGRKPVTPAHSVCVECKLRGTCLRDGGARHALPRPGDPCRLRRALPELRSRLLRLLRPEGDAEYASSLSRWLGELGMSERDLQRVYRTFNANAEPFREEGERHGA